MTDEPTPEVAYESAKRGANGGKLHLVPDCHQLASTTPREVSLDAFPPAHRNWCGVCGPNADRDESAVLEAGVQREADAGDNDSVAGPADEGGQSDFGRINDDDGEGEGESDHGDVESTDRPGGRVAHTTRDERRVGVNPNDRQRGETR